MGAWSTDSALIQEPMFVLAVLLAVLATLFSFAKSVPGKKFFRVIPVLFCAYFVPMLLSNLGIIPQESAYPLYAWVKAWLLPASLVLLVLAVDLKAMASLGRPAVLMFLGATVTIIVGGPLAFWLGKDLIPDELGDQAWKGLAALAGSWIGGGANFIAIGESVGAKESTLSLMVVIDIAVAETWMAILLFFAGREKRMDEAIGADRGALDEVRKQAEAYQASVAKPTNMTSVLVILALAFGVTAVAHFGASLLPDVGEVMREFTWIVLLVTLFGLLLSFSRARNLEGVGASALGSAFLYLLVTTIGAKADLGMILDPDNFGLLVIGAIWMCFHATALLALRRWIKAPIFFLAVGSRANVGGAASAPVVASAFHPALAPVGVLLAIVGYVLGTVGGIACAFLLSLVA